LHLLGIEFHSSLTEFESLLNERSELTNSTTLISKDLLRVSCADNDFGSGRSDADFTTGVTLFGELTGEEFVYFSEEYAIGDKLSSISFVFKR
jgi:hypothetical protein